MIGFTYYNEIPVVTNPTTAEMVAALSATQRLAILNGFAKGILAKTLGYQAGIKRNVVGHLYGKFNDIELLARQYMRGEVLITPATYDDEGNELTPNVYNIPITTSANLITEISTDFIDDFTVAQSTSILTKMVSYSKYNGTGTWTYYKTEIIK